MKGHISPSVAFEDLNSALGKEFRRRNNICRFGVSTQSDDGRVLKQEQRVTNAGVLAERYQLFLQAQAGSVVESAELEDRNHNKTVSPQGHRDTGKIKESPVVL